MKSELAAPCPCRPCLCMCVCIDTTTRMLFVNRTYTCDQHVHALMFELICSQGTLQCITKLPKLQVTQHPRYCQICLARTFLTETRAYIWCIFAKTQSILLSENKQSSLSFSFKPHWCVAIQKASAISRLSSKYAVDARSRDVAHVLRVTRVKFLDDELHKTARREWPNRDSYRNQMCLYIRFTQISCQTVSPVVARIPCICRAVCSIIVDTSLPAMPRYG